MNLGFTKWHIKKNQVNGLGGLKFIIVRTRETKITFTHR